ncbi:MAG: two-component system, chemotaxis family, sensor kinase CheA [Gemmatimonadaceae bacterium]|nr:two-component system, chemotaxis family, sensor kinase CheA [Gemmatimonadaceae bacterium]
MDTGRYAKLFLSESRENLSEINNALVELERGGSITAIDRLFRAVHTMKGMGGAMGYTSVSELSHELETLLDRLRTGSLNVTAVIMDTLFAGVDALEIAVDLATAATPTQFDATEVLARIKAASSEEIPQTFTTEFAIMSVAKNEEEAKAPVSKAARHIRIDSKRLDALMNLMGELVIARDRIAQIAERIGDEALVEATLRASQIVATLQNEIMNSRMVPVWQVFDRFPRVVRDTARSLSKEVEFKIEGKEIELDRSMLDEMGEPVLHLLRNSLDHGIETPAERKKAGKPPTATLTLTAERDRATVLIRVTDDGRGIDQAKVLPRAKKLGLVDVGTSHLSEDELVRIISRPGFSTAEKVTDISGRGVGFDIVANKVRALGGSLEVHTDSGLGTSVSMRLPLTLAITRALIARVDTEVYAIPLTHVLETFALSQPMLQEIKGKEVVAIRDDVFPAIWLRDRVGLPASNKVGGQVVLVELADRRAALIVDEFTGQQEIVVKQFDGVIGSRTLFSGATILGDGAPALIVDASTLL